MEGGSGGSAWGVTRGAEPPTPRRRGVRPRRRARSEGGDRERQPVQRAPGGKAPGRAGRRRASRGGGGVPCGDAPDEVRGPRWNSGSGRGPGKPRKARKGPGQCGKKQGPATALLPALTGALPDARAPASPAPLLPSPQDLTPPPAHRGSGLRAPRAPSAAPLHRRCRRHLPPAAVTQRRRCTSRAAGK